MPRGVFPRHPKPVSERLTRRTVETPPPAHCPELGPCLEWVGARKGNGYGAIALGGRDGGVGYVHRVAYELSVGPIPEGMEVCHRCDNRVCVRPGHLFLGDHAANARDMSEKGRSTLGERHGMVALTENQVIEMRRLWESGSVSQLELAAQFNTTKVNVSQIVRGDRWKHLLPDDWEPPAKAKWSRRR